VPYAAHLGTAQGRDYLRIVAQLAPRFASWDQPNPGTGPYLRDILSVLEQRTADLVPALRRERVVEMIMLMTVAASERARLVEARPDQEIDHDTFAANLTDVLVGILEAPLRGPLPSAVTDVDRGVA
jgi:hypothetical protein